MKTEGAVKEKIKKEMENFLFEKNPSNYSGADFLFTSVRNGTAGNFIFTKLNLLL